MRNSTDGIGKEAEEAANRQHMGLFTTLLKRSAKKNQNRALQSTTEMAMP